MTTAVEDTVSIGKELGKSLRAIGIETREKLLELGDEAAFTRLTARFAEDACTHTRLTVAGAVRGVRWFGLDKELRAELTKGLSRWPGIPAESSIATQSVRSRVGERSNTKQLPPPFQATIR